MLEQEQISTKDFISVKLTIDNIEVGIKYKKQSTFKKRFESIEKLKEVLRKI